MSECPSNASSAIPPSIIAAYRNPNFEEFLSIREEYHGISDDLQRKVDETGEAGPSTAELKEYLENTDKVFKRVKRPQEARLDISILKQITTLAKNNAEKTSSNLIVFKPNEFADKLITYCKNLTNDVAFDDDEKVLFGLPERAIISLGSELSSLYSHTSGLEPLYGALEWKPPERKASQRAAADRVPAVTKMIEKVASLTTNEETSLDEVSRILSVLKSIYRENRHQPICFYEFVVNPKCFTTTIENIFHVSFLLRDGFVEIKPDADKIAHIIPVTNNEQSSGNGNEKEKVGCQAVITMDRDDWMELIEVLELERKEPMIPFRNQNRKKRHN